MAKIPGVAWQALLVFLGTWVTQYFGGEAWAAGAVVAIGAVAKLIETYIVGNEPKLETPTSERSATRPEGTRPGSIRWSRTLDLFLG